MTYDLSIRRYQFLAIFVPAVLVFAFSVGAIANLAILIAVAGPLYIFYLKNSELKRWIEQLTDFIEARIAR